MLTFDVWMVKSNRGADATTFSSILAGIVGTLKVNCLEAERAGAAAGVAAGGVDFASTEVVVDFPLAGFIENAGWGMLDLGKELAVDDVEGTVGTVGTASLALPVLPKSDDAGFD